jgi:hypothetical protein
VLFTFIEYNIYNIDRPRSVQALHSRLCPNLVGITAFLDTLTEFGLRIPFIGSGPTHWKPLWLLHSCVIHCIATDCCVWPDQLKTPLVIALQYCCIVTYCWFTMEMKSTSRCIATDICRLSLMWEDPTATYT